MMQELTPTQTAIHFGWLLENDLRIHEDENDKRYKDMRLCELIEHARNAWRGVYNIVVDDYIIFDNALLYSVFITVANERFELMYEPDNDTFKQFICRSIYD